MSAVDLQREVLDLLRWLGEDLREEVAEHIAENRRDIFIDQWGNELVDVGSYSARSVN